MKIDRLEVKQFRNLAEQVFEAEEGINVIFGKNAQGKTNLMEALWLFTGNKSFRGAKESEMIALGCKSARLSVTFTDRQRQQKADDQPRGGAGRQVPGCGFCHKSPSGVHRNFNFKKRLHCIL